MALGLASSAAAATRIGSIGSGPGEFANLDAVAVSASEGPGDIYTTDGRNNRVEQFTPAGAFVRAFGWGIVPGAASGTGDLTVGSTTITAATTTSGEFIVGQVLTGSGIPPNDAIRRVGAGEIDLERAPKASGSGVELEAIAGPGNVPTDEVQKLTVKAAAGTFVLTFQSPQPDSITATTAPISATATHEALQSALAALPNIGPGNVSVSGGPGDEAGTSPYLIEFSGRYADANVRSLRVEGSGLSGGSAEATLTTLTEGGGALETCTTVCTGEDREQEGGVEPAKGAPGQLDFPDEIAVDNDPSSSSYGDVYVIDQRDFRVEKYSPEGHFLLMFGGEVDKTTHANVCTEEDLENGDICGAGVPGTGPAHFYRSSTVLFNSLEGPVYAQSWSADHSSSIAVGPDGTVYVGDFRRVQEFDSDGTYAGQLNLPEAQFVSSLAIDTASHVYADSPALNEEQKLIPPASGSYTITFEGQTTSPLSFEAQAEEVQLALRALSTIGGSNVDVGSAGGGFSVNFVAALGNANLPQMTAAGATVETLAEGAGEELAELAGPAAAEPSEVLRTLDSSGEPTHIALDSSGDLLASDFTGGFIRPSCSGSSDENCPEARFRAFKPDGSLYSIFTSPDVITHSPTGNPRGLAFDPATGKLYATTEQAGAQYVAVLPPPVTGPPLVEPGSEEATDVEPATAVLHAIVNPGGFDTHYQVEYITEAQFKHNEEEGKEGFENAEKTPLKDLGALIQGEPLSVPLAGLQPATTYRWRVLASSECNGAVPPAEKCIAEGERNESGEEVPQVFSTLPAVSVSELTTQTVGPELVTLKAQLNPNNGIGTEYTFRYGETEAYEGGSSRGTLPIGGDFKPVHATFTGLKPNTPYHYQLIVRNASGEVRSSDQTFTTELSVAEERAAEDCPNGSRHGEPGSTIREEDNSLDLPDCRAYEQVTEPEKNGGRATFEGLAPSGERLTYSSAGVFDGAVENGLEVQYVAHRTASGWFTQPVLGRLDPPSTEPFAIQKLFNPELDRWLFVEAHGSSLDAAAQAQISAYFSMGLGDGSFILHASPVIAPLEGAGRSPFYFLDVEGVSNDLSHALILTGARLLASDPRPDHDVAPQSEADRLYELTGVGGGSPSLHLLAEVPTGLTATGSFGGTGGCFLDWPYQAISHSNNGFANEPPASISGDGSTVVYSAPIEEAKGFECGEGKPNPLALFARTAENPPVQLNAPPPAQCTEPHPCATVEPKTPLYDGLSEDGRYVWFTTTQPLVNSDTDHTNDIYVAKLAPGGQLEELIQASAGEATVTHPVPGVGADVGETGVTSDITTEGINQGVVRISADGTHAAFVSPAVLTEEPNALGQSAVRHANNLYLYDLTSQKTKFVTELCSGPERSGSEPPGGSVVTKANSVYDPACPATTSDQLSPGLPENTNGPLNDDALWMHGNGGEAEITPDGNDLLFSSFGRLTPDDTDEQPDLFRYDFQTGQLTRVSIGHRGNDGNGNDNAYLPEFAGQRAISADGSTVIFRTAAPLVSRDTNQTSPIPSCREGGSIGEAVHSGCDIYEWSEDGHGTCTEAPGCVSLISTGHTPNLGDTTAEIGASGRDILFQTASGLIPGDTDGVPDVYDARVDGGFHPQTPPPICTSPEACGEALGSPPSPPTVGTPNFVGSGNSPTALQCAKGRHRARRHGQSRCVPNKHSKHKRSHRSAHRRGGK